MVRFTPNDLYIEHTISICVFYRRWHIAQSKRVHTYSIQSIKVTSERMWKFRPTCVLASRFSRERMIPTSDVLSLLYRLCTPSYIMLNVTCHRHASRFSENILITVRTKRGITGIKSLSISRFTSNVSFVGTSIWCCSSKPYDFLFPTRIRIKHVLLN